MRVIVESGEQGFLDFLGRQAFFFFFFSPFFFCAASICGVLWERRRGWVVSILCVRAATDTFLELGMACKPELQGKKGGHSERWMISGQETAFLLGFSSLVNHGN
jgi:hypothetical protein